MLLINPMIFPWYIHQNSPWFQDISSGSSHVSVGRKPPDPWMLKLYVSQLMVIPYRGLLLTKREPVPNMWASLVGRCLINTVNCRLISINSTLIVACSYKPEISRAHCFWQMVKPLLLVVGAYLAHLKKKWFFTCVQLEDHPTWLFQGMIL